jgi:hypothetical protein
LKEDFKALLMSFTIQRGWSDKRNLNNWTAIMLRAKKIFPLASLVTRAMGLSALI